jgi:8-oxo-dGTP diphosphatase/2-hydroxy-dATP diphosphatase
MNKVKTLCIIERNNQILMGMKKRGFGEGWWNGFGGKVEEGEEIEEAAIRETKEEVGIQVNRLEERGMILFHFEGDPDPIEMHIFAVLESKGEPIESEEMKPEWFDKDKIPYEKMWPADRQWMPIYLEGKYFGGEVHFTQDKEVIDFDIHEVTPQAIEKKG